MNTNSLNVKVCKSIDEAPKYNAPEFKAASILNVVLVKGGTVEGNSTVDIVFVDDNGQKFVTMTTLSLLKSLVAFD